VNIHVPVVSARKDVALEGLRGLASITVLIWHLILGFYPEMLGDYGRAVSGSGIRGHFWFGLVYGSAAVALFFVLSGYVLTLKFFRSGGDLIILRRAAIKRWPRLAGPVLLAVLLSWMIGSLGFYQYVEGAAITKSQWLAGFANAVSQRGFEGRTFLDALSQGAFLTFLRGDSYFNTNIWTMRIEFLGSLISYGMAPLLIGLGTAASAFAIFVVIMLCHYGNLILVGFPVGVAMALVRARNPDWELGLPAAVTALLVAVYLFGYSGLAVHDYAWLGRFHEIYAHCIAAILAIGAIELCPAVNRCFSTRFSRYIGNASFPLYLVHLPVLCSVGCTLLIATGSRVVAAICVIIVSFLLATVFAIANNAWLRWVNKLVSRIV
jgi:peptidoglycan/LPS O-acetylase OafA/YrhL